MKYLDKLKPTSDFVALDVETTGHSHQLDVVAEIGAIRYRDGFEIDRFVTLVKPATPMLPWITRLTGITDRMLDRAPAPTDVAGRLTKFVGRRPLVVHNAVFDVPILERFVSRHGPVRRRFVGELWEAPPVMCTLRFARKMLPHLPSRRLEALADYFDFTPRHPRRHRFHSAATDAEAAAHVFFCLSAMAVGL